MKARLASKMEMLDCMMVMLGNMTVMLDYRKVMLVSSLVT